MGNHEYLMAVALSNIKLPICRSTILDDAAQQGLQLWLEDGGQPTFMNFLELPPELQKQVVKFLGKLLLYIEVSAGERRFVLVHSGLKISRRRENWEAIRQMSFCFSETLSG